MPGSGDRYNSGASIRSQRARNNGTLDSIIASRRARADFTYYVEGDGRRIPDTDPDMAAIRVLVTIVKQQNEVLSPTDRSRLNTLVSRLSDDWYTATWGRSTLALPLLLRRP